MQDQINENLTLIRVGVLGVSFEVGREVELYPSPRLKLLRIMLET